jgi:hypothetical protein
MIGGCLWSDNNHQLHDATAVLSATISRLCFQMINRIHSCMQMIPTQSSITQD